MINKKAQIGNSFIPSEEVLQLGAMCVFNQRKLKTAFAGLPYPMPQSSKTQNILLSSLQIILHKNHDFFLKKMQLLIKIAT